MILPGHSKLGASSMHRWDRCPGSVKLSEGLENVSSEHAAGGTVAHGIAAMALADESFIAPEGRIGEIIKQDGHDIEVTSEMIEAVQVYLDAVRADMDSAMFDCTLSVEKRFHLKQVHAALYGTSDATLLLPKQRLLIVYDYKHGSGVTVNVKDNPQLLYYALGQLLEMEGSVDYVEIAVVQPRCLHPDGPVRRQRMAAIDLVNFSADLLEAVHRTEAPDAPLVAGDHCRWCPAAGVCPKLMEHANDRAKLVFAPEKKYDPAVLAATLDWLPVFEAWVTSVRAFAYNEALANRVPPSYKLVEIVPRRQWKDAIIAEEVLSLEVEEETLYKPREMHTPPALEKALTAAKMPKKERDALLTPLVAKVSSGLTLVHESDRREAVKRDAATVFAATAN